MKRSTHRTISTVVLMFLSSCGQGVTTNNAATPCVAGATIPCACPDGSSSAKVCDTGVFGACVCGDATVGSDTLADANLDSASAGDAGSDTVDLELAVDAATDVAAGSDALGSDATGSPQCQSDKDCTAAGLVCDPLTKMCVPCLSDVDCPASHHCVGLTCLGFTTCSNSLGCTNAKGPDGLDQPICDPKGGECTACLTAADCPLSTDCVAKACVPFTACQNSTECKQDEVCDKATNRCVQCLGNNDCATNELCEAGACKPFVACASDKQCTPQGLLCDTDKGKCAQCLQNTDCPAIYNCQKVAVAQTGACVLDACAQGQGACSGNAKVTCNAAGDGYDTPQACGAKTTCVAPGGQPQCKPWVCEPGVTCDGDKSVTCGADGLTIVATEDCAASGGKCVAGTCQSTICVASATWCDNATLKTCNADGTAIAKSQVCGPSWFCGTNGSGDAACLPIVCNPGQPSCDGNLATSCNADGSGYAPSGEDCTTSGKVCSGGACAKLLCDPQNPLYCSGNVVKQCDASGLNPTLFQTCQADQYCASGVCQLLVCAPGQPTCSGNNLATCNADGTGYAAVGTACPAGASCKGGSCEAPLLPLCTEAKGSCALCSLCPAYPLCTLKEIGQPDMASYANDCAAICALNAVNGLSKDTNGKFWQGQCPACPLCSPDDVKLKDPYCVTLKSGAKLTVDHKCEVGCVADAAFKADGVTINASIGACKFSCTNPVSSGGAGCLTGGQPICAKEDNATYTNTCKMQNCDVTGCFPVGAAAKTAGCTPDAMTKECDGACYDATKTPSCSAECSPVCGIKKIMLSNGLTQVLGTSYRSQCVAAANGATVGACDGISATPADACAAGMLYKAKGCCENVDYGVVSPVCGSKSVPGKPDQYVTFQNQGEYDCLTAGDPSWVWEYTGRCECSCSHTVALVCGADGKSYLNACQAACLNPEGGFTWVNGACP